MILVRQQSLTIKFVQKIYQMYTHIIQNTKFVYILHTKILQIKSWCDNECTKNVHQIPMHVYTKYVQTVQNCYKVQTKNVCFYLKCMFFVHKNNVQTM